MELNYMSNHAYLAQTAEDYYLDIDIVEKIYRLSIDGNEFHQKLEQELKARRK